jgi:peptidoglycan/LPS O-acetylase OafA/YrhL
MKINIFQRTGGGIIPGLDGLRAISILCVIYAHLLWTPSFPFKFLAYVVNPANLGVRMFFVISGFLITSILLKEREKTGGVSLRKFYYRRTLRIFPAYYVFLACVFVLALVGVIGLERSDYFYTATYTFNLKGRQNTWWVGHTWSLAVEEQFYLLWPIAVSRLRAPTLKRIAFAFLFLAPVGQVTLSMVSPAAFDHWYLALPLVADPIAIGALLALYCQDARHKARLQAFIGGSWVWLMPVMILGIEALHNRPNFFPHPAVLMGLLEPIVNIGLMLIVAKVALTPKGRATRILNSPILVAIGVLSYSLYLWQMLFLSPVPVRAFTFPLNLLWVFVAATASFVLIERPFNALRKKSKPVAAGLVTETSSAELVPNGSLPAAACNVASS